MIFYTFYTFWQHRLDKPQAVCALLCFLAVKRGFTPFSNGFLLFSFSGYYTFYTFYTFFQTFKSEQWQSRNLTARVS